MKKRFITKKKKSFNYKFLFIVLFYLIFLFIFYKYLEHENIKINDKKLVRILLKDSNHHNKDKNNIINKLISKFNINN